MMSGLNVAAYLERIFEKIQRMDLLSWDQCFETFAKY